MIYDGKKSTLVFGDRSRGVKIRFFRNFVAKRKKNSDRPLNNPRFNLINLCHKLKRRPKIMEMKEIFGTFNGF